MGCAQSKLDSEEVVSRCKERKLFMKEAVAARNAFASAHSAYAVALRDTGAALHDYAQVEVPDVVCSTSTDLPPQSASSAAKSPIDSSLPPPPPPPPEFGSSPLQRAVSMPDLPPPKIRRRKSGDQGFQAAASIAEDDGGDPETLDRAAREAPPRTPPPGWDYFFGADDGVPRPPPPKEEKEEEAHRRTNSDPPIQPVEEIPAPPIAPETPVATKSVQRQKAPKITTATTTSSVSFLQILISLDDHFLKAYESAQSVSTMLEAKRLHYHSNFADNRGHIDHSARVMRAITWNRSFKGLGGDEGRDEFEADSWETHATILDKLLAWEKKLFDEVKASERMKLDYQRKVAKLNKQKKHGASAEALAATKAEVSHLHTRYIVDMQSMDSTVSEIQRLRDVQLYEKLTELVKGMADMWEVMFSHHNTQLKLVQGITAVDVSNALKETSEQLRSRTSQLCDMTARWSKNFNDLVTYKKNYIKSLNEWLRLSLIPIESSLTERVSSPARPPPPPPIRKLLVSWQEHLGKISDDRAKSAISSFAAVVTAILEDQNEERKLKEKCEEFNKDYLRKLHAFEEWHQSYVSKKPPPLPVAEDGEPNEETGEVATYRDLVEEKQLPVKAAKKKLEEEVEKHGLKCKQAREKAVNSLKIHLPELFRAMTEFSNDCTQMYKALSAMNPPPAS